MGVVLAASLIGEASAQVLDIAPDGAVTTLNGPGVSLDPGGPPQSLTPDQPAPPAPAGPTRATIAAQLQSAAVRNGLSPKVVEAVAWRESRFNPDAISPKGAVGVMQLMPATARAMGIDPRDSAANLDAGAAYLAQMLRTFNGDLTLALAAYNAGPRAVRQYAGAPPFPETKAFVGAILGRLADTVAVENAR
jgi:soluble lytic murein transglycosylase-like protein